MKKLSNSIFCVAACFFIAAIIIFLLKGPIPIVSYLSLISSPLFLISWRIEQKNN